MSQVDENITITSNNVFTFSDNLKLEQSPALSIKKRNILIETEERPCRICLESLSTDKNPLIHPCKCSGSIKFIHEECLKTWIVSQAEDIDHSHCELCKTKYKMSYRLVRRCNTREGLRSSCSKCLFVPIIITVMLMMFLIAYLLGQKYFSSSSTAEHQIYAIALTITCTVSGIILAFVLVSAVRQTCYTERVEEWKILSSNLSEVENHKELSDADTEKINEMRKQTLVIPKMVRLRGRQVRAPALRPSLTPISRSGRVIAFSPAFLTPSEAVKCHDDTFSDFSPIRDRIDNSLMHYPDSSIRGISKKNNIFVCPDSFIRENVRENSMVSLFKE